MATPEPSHPLSSLCTEMFRQNEVPRTQQPDWEGARGQPRLLCPQWVGRRVPGATGQNLEPRVLLDQFCLLSPGLGQVPTLPVQKFPF